MTRGLVVMGLFLSTLLLLLWGGVSVLRSTDEIDVAIHQNRWNDTARQPKVNSGAAGVADNATSRDSSAVRGALDRVPKVQTELRPKTPNAAVIVATVANTTTHRQLKADVEVLPNGIRLPREWPPADVTFEHLIAKRPPRPPYLESPPKVINIDVGRQLFVDNFLVQRTNAVHTFHRAIYRDVVLKPVHQEWHSQSPKWTFSTVGFHRVGTSRPFSRGIWYDDVLKRFIAHYRCGYIYSGIGRPCVVLSDDGVHWTRPSTTKDQFSALDLKKINNAPVNLLRLPFTEAFTTWLDPHEGNPEHRFKAVVRAKTNIGQMSMHSSPDGITWKSYGSETRKDGHKTGIVTDRASLYYDPFRRKWVYSIRENLCRGGHGHLRVSRYKEVDALKDSSWPQWVSLKNYFQCAVPKPKEPVYWIGVDNKDCEGDNVEECDLYHIDATPYESIFVGQLAILYPGYAHGGCKSSKIHVGFSRDGFHFSRTEGGRGKSRKPMVDDPLNLNYQQPIAGNFVVVGDEIFVYYAGATQCKRCNDPKLDYCTEGNFTRDGLVKPTDSSMIEVTALAILRRDGFASFAPPPSGQSSELVTRAVTFTHGVYFFVNADVLAAGTNPSFAAEMRVAILDSNMNEIPEFSIANCNPIRAVNQTKIMVEWGSSSRLSALQRQHVHFRFVMQGGARLYAFWVSKSIDGASSGYINGGTPKITSRKLSDGRSESE